MSNIKTKIKNIEKIIKSKEVLNTENFKPSDEIGKARKERRLEV